MSACLSACLCRVGIQLTKRTDFIIQDLSLERVMICAASKESEVFLPLPQETLFGCIVNQLNPFPTITPYLFNIHFYIIIPPTTSLPLRPLPCHILNKI